MRRCDGITGLVLIGVSSCMGATLGLAGVLCVETPGEVTTDAEPAQVVTPWLS